MSRQFEDLLDEDECCLNCGELDFKPSKIMGLCITCFKDPKNSLEIIDEGSEQFARSPH